MEEVKRKVNRYDVTTFGFDIAWLCSFDNKLRLRQVILLNKVMTMFNSEGMQCKYFNGRKHVWISYDQVLDNFKGTQYSKRSLVRDIADMEEKGILSREVMTVDLRARSYIGFSDEVISAFFV